jgi:6-phosphogluconolactonase
MLCFHLPARLRLLILGLFLVGGLAGPASGGTGQSSDRSAPEKDARRTGRLWVYIGTYNVRASKGIYLCQLDLADGKLEAAALAAETANATFLVHHPGRPLLYAINEVMQFSGQPTGSVSAFAIQPRTGRLTLLNQEPSGGRGPCHLAIDRGGRWVLTANYVGGSVACLPIGGDGRLGVPTCIVQHHGTGAIRQRQEAPHAHSIYLDAANRFALAADLGIDRIMVYCFDAQGGKLRPNQPPSFAAAPGAGPRHMAFHPNGRYVYAINELASTVTAMRYDAARGTLEAIQELSTLPADFDGSNTTAEVQIDAAGRFLYGSNRGHNSIAIFAVDGGTGKLRAVGHTPTGGKSPRNFALDPTGRWLLAANQDTDNVVLFRIEPASGSLRPAGHSVAVPAPVCVEMLQPIAE